MRYILMLFFAVLFYGCGSADHPTSKIFDVHLHGDATPAKQLSNLAANGVYTLAVSTSWQDQQKYQSNKKVNVLHGLFCHAQTEKFRTVSNPVLMMERNGRMQAGWSNRL